LYLGGIQNGQFHGTGTLYPKNGQIQRGTFCQNKLQEDDIWDRFKKFYETPAKSNGGTAVSKEETKEATNIWDHFRKVQGYW
jgi:hypothetical protein